MDDLIGLVIFAVFVGLSLIGRVMKSQEKREGQGRPQYPGPVAGPGIPGGGQSRPRQAEGQSPPPWPPQRESQAPPQWPQPAPRPQPQPSLGHPRPAHGEGVRTEGYSSMLGGSVEGRSSMATGTMAENRASFRSQTEKWLDARLETGLHGSTPAAEVVLYNQQAHSLVEVLSSPRGLAHGVLLAEILGKPRALRPRGRR